MVSSENAACETRQAKSAYTYPLRSPKLQVLSKPNVR